MNADRRSRRAGRRGARAAILPALMCGAILVSAGGCEDAPAPRAESADEVPAASPRSGVVDTLLIEGRAEVLPVATFAGGEDFPLPFRTVVPDTGRLTARVEDVEGTGGLSAAARFEWPTASVPAFLRFVVLDRGISDNTARGIVRGIGTDFGIIGSQGIEQEEAVPPPGHRWASLGYRLRGEVGGRAVDGWVSMGRHGGRIFYFMALYPPEYADGLGPRFDYILRHWTWLDTGEALER